MALDLPLWGQWFNPQRILILPWGGRNIQTWVIFAFKHLVFPPQRLWPTANSLGKWELPSLLIQPLPLWSPPPSRDTSSYELWWSMKERKKRNKATLHCVTDLQTKTETSHGLFLFWSSVQLTCCRLLQLWLPLFLLIWVSSDPQTFKSSF